MKHKTVAIKNPEDPLGELVKAVWEVMQATCGGVYQGQVHSTDLKFTWEGKPYTLLAICKPGHVKLDQQVLVEQIVTMYQENT